MTGFRTAVGWIDNRFIDAEIGNACIAG